MFKKMDKVFLGKIKESRINDKNLMILVVLGLIIPVRFIDLIFNDINILGFIFVWFFSTLISISFLLSIHKYLIESALLKGEN